MEYKQLLEAGNCAERISAKVLEVVLRGCGKREPTSEDQVYLKAQAQKLVRALEQTSDQDARPLKD